LVEIVNVPKKFVSIRVHSWLKKVFLETTHPPHHHLDRRLALFLAALGFAVKNSELVTLHYYLGASWQALWCWCCSFAFVLARWPGWRPASAMYTASGARFSV